MNDQGLKTMICKKRLLNSGGLIQQVNIKEVLHSVAKYKTFVSERKKYALFHM